MVGVGSFSRRVQIFASALALLFSQGCAVLQRPLETPTATPAVQPKSEQGAPQVKLPQTGEASWYGPEHQGKPTASGQLFDQARFTAAHRTLPFGTKVKVTNLANGKSVEVEINDRGPYAENRIIDLSGAAAKALDMTGSGTAKVRLELASGP